MPHILHSTRNGRPRASIFYWRNYGALGIVGFPFLLRIKILAPLFPGSITQIQRRTTRRSPFATKLSAPSKKAPSTPLRPSAAAPQPHQSRYHHGIGKAAGACRRQRVLCGNQGHQCHVRNEKIPNISARNQIEGTVVAVKDGAVNSHVAIKDESGVRISGSITNQAARLGSSAQAFPQAG